MKIVDFIKAKKYEDIVIISFLFSLTFATAGYFSTLGIDPHHDGLMLKPALDFAEGKILFRESFTQYGALTTILQGVSLALFGKYLLVIKLLTAFFYALTAILLYLVWSNVLPRYLALTSCLIWLLLAPYFVWPFLAWSSVYALFFQLLSLQLLILFVKKHKRYLLFMSGFSAALCFWCRQPVGVFLICAITIFIAVYCSYKRDYSGGGIVTAAFPILGFIACTSLFVFWLLLNGALYDCYLQSIKAAYDFAADSGFSMILKIIANLFFPLSAGRIEALTRIALIRIVWTIIPIVSIVIFLALVKSLKAKQPDINNEIIAAILLISFASLLQNYPIPDIRHMYWAETPMIGMVIYWYREISAKKHADKRSVLLVLLIFATFSPDIVFRVYQGYARIKKYNVSFEYPLVLSGIKSSPADVALQKEIAEKLEYYYNRPGSAGMVNLTGDALYMTYIKGNDYFHKIYVNWLNALYPDYCEELNRKIVNDRPVILKSIKDPAIPGYRTGVRFKMPDLEFPFLARVELLSPLKNYNTEADGEYPYKGCR